MKTNHLFRTIVIFAALVVAGILLIVLPQPSTVDTIPQILPLIGSAMFGSGLTYFLIVVTFTQGGGKE
jgi:drug/metabolite transporter (DMT)-like permease